MKKELIKQLAVQLYNMGYHVISGKLFNKDNIEIKLNDFVRDLWLGKIKCSYDLERTEIDNIIDNLYTTNVNDWWPDLPRVVKARELGPLPKDTKLPFPLDEKQLIIIDRLLFHREGNNLFITTGIGGSGKSTFLNIVKQLFDNDVSPASISQLGNEFTQAEAVKCRLIASDELSTGELNNADLKKMSDHNDIYCNPKGTKGYASKCQSQFIWSCNKVPRIDATDTGIMRRIVFYERNTKIQNPDPTLSKKIYTEDELLLIARVALAYEDDHWKDVFDEETHKLIMKDNSVNLCPATTYQEYVDSCRCKGLRAFSEPNWLEISSVFDEWTREAQAKKELEELDKQTIEEEAKREVKAFKEQKPEWYW